MLTWTVWYPHNNKNVKGNGGGKLGSPRGGKTLHKLKLGCTDEGLRINQENLVQL